MMNELYLGFAEADITPDGPVEMVGFGREDNISRGVMAKLTAQLSLWRLSGETCCLVCIDHIGFSRAHADELRDALANVIQTDRQRVMLCFSHTHSGPNDSAEEAYFRCVCARLIDCAARARDDMRPVRAGWENGRTDAGVNRREGATAMDDRLGALKAEDAETGETRLILLRVTAHANALKRDNYLISPDFFGPLRDALRARYGCPVMLTQGASGNIAPRYFQSKISPPDAVGPRFIRSETGVADMATRVLSAAVPAIDAISASSVSALRAYSRFLTLTADVPDETRALTVAREAREICGIDGENWLNEVRRLRNAGVICQSEETEVQYLQIGGFCLCGIPNEIMCEFALRARDILRDPHFYFGGYTNGCTGYFPSEEEFDLGGYEVYWSMLTYYMYYGRVYPLRRDCASQLIAFAAENAPARLFG